MIADRGYDSDPLRERLRRRGIELIVPYRENNPTSALRRQAQAAAIPAPLDRGADQMLGWDNFAGCWFVMSIYLPPIATQSIVHAYVSHITDPIVSEC